MRRREFIGFFAGAGAFPYTVSAQQTAMPVIGFLSIRSPGDSAYLMDGFRLGLKEAGYVQGQNAAIEFRFAANKSDQLPALAADLVRRQVRVIATFGATAASAAKAATRTIPVVFGTGGNPIRLGLVASLNRPGGNVTGVTQVSVEVGPKRLELVREMVPTATTVALLVNPTNPLTDTLSRDLQEAAGKLGLQLHVLRASTEGDLTMVFASLTKLRASALVIGPDAFFNSRSEQLAALTFRQALPTIYQYREFTAAGGLMSYGGSLPEVYRMVGAYSGRILKGDKPGDLPVEQVTKIELIINIKTAKHLGLTVPPTLLARADEVIE
jgi:putative tryptophan/tyrosine transport system substrate-binding protein